MTIPSQSYWFSRIVTLYFFFLVSLVLHTLASPTLNSCGHDQRDALLEFKREFPVNESNPLLRSWNKSTDCCSWAGITCDAKSGKVISFELTPIPLQISLKPNSGLFKLQHLRNLTFHGCGLYGEIPSSLGNLSHLTHLNLMENNLVGEVPASIGNLTQLRYLDLGNNHFSGYIPVSFAKLTKLFHLDISGNQFTGEFPPVLLNLTSSLSFLAIRNNLFKSTLPPDMSRLNSLEKFYAGGNSFYGPFPTSLFMIPSLTLVSMGDNQFKGPIEFRNITSSSKLMSLDLRQNKFDGLIHKSISKFSNLYSLYLSDNNFTGPIPKSISKFSDVYILDLSDNNFTGPIPISISKFPNLYDLDLSNNNLIRPIPTFPSLESLDLSNNMLEGEIPGWFGGVSNLILSHNSFSSFGKLFQVFQLRHYIGALDLSSNSFRRPLPHWICNLGSSYLLDLSNNSFSGSIPKCMSNTIVRLRVLNLQNNNLSGILPPDLFVNGTELVSVDVSGNQLEGKLPESLINCTSLLILNVGSNRIKDKFPSWLGSLQRLNVLNLRSNEFYGHVHVSVGFQSLRVIDISHNHFNGTLSPFSFSRWHEMIVLTKEYGVYMGDRQFRISMEIVNKGVNMLFELIRKDFTTIDFSENNFCGEIPKSIGLLKELRLLNMSGNSFTSNIPQSLANLTKLEALDLSRNQLSGQIPSNLGSLSFLSAMNFSHNNLEGPIPRGTQFQRQKCSSFMDNPNLYGLEDICGKTHDPNPTPQEFEDLSEPEEQVISWIAAAIAYGPGVFCGLVTGHIFSTHIHKWFM